MDKDGQKFFIIDICGTLFKSNTTLDFIKFFWGDYILVKFLFSLPFRIFNRLVYRLCRLEPLRISLIRFLKGKSREELQSMAARFYEEFLLNRTNKNIMNLVEMKRREGFQLILVSATLDIIAEEVSSRMKIPFLLSSALKYSPEGICMGKLQQDLLAQKCEKLADISIFPPYGGIVTDNYSDASLIEQTKEPFLVCYGASEGRWAKQLSNKTIERCHFLKV